MKLNFKYIFIIIFLFGILCGNTNASDSEIKMDYSIKNNKEKTNKISFYWKFKENNNLLYSVIQHSNNNNFNKKNFIKKIENNNIINNQSVKYKDGYWRVCGIYVKTNKCSNIIKIKNNNGYYFSEIRKNYFDFLEKKINNKFNNKKEINKVINNLYGDIRKALNKKYISQKEYNKLRDIINKKDNRSKYDLLVNYIEKNKKEIKNKTYIVNLKIKNAFENNKITKEEKEKLKEKIKFITNPSYKKKKIKEKVENKINNYITNVNNIYTGDNKKIETYKKMLDKINKKYNKANDELKLFQYNIIKNKINKEIDKIKVKDVDNVLNNILE